MPNHQSPEFSRLEALRDRFNDGALAYPGVNAVVVFQPEIRREDTIRQVQEALKRQDTSVYTGDGKYAREAHRFTHRSAEWVPGYDKSIEDMGCQRYCNGHIFEPIDDNQSYWKSRVRWGCEEYGPPVGHINPAQSVLTVLATGAAKLVLGFAGDDRDLITNWLAHLATQPEESSTHRPRRFLDLSEYPHASWPCVNPRRPPAWWAIRLENVFHHSGKAVQRAIDAPISPNTTSQLQADLAEHTTRPPAGDAGSRTSTASCSTAGNLVVPSGEPNAQDQLSLKQALTVATLIEAETEKPSVEDDPHQNPATDPAIDLEAQALALLFQESWDSVEQIAERLRVDRKTPYKWKRF